MRVSKTFHMPSRTKQSFAKECDINNLMKKYEKDGLIDHVNQHRGYYGDLPLNIDYQHSLNVILAAERSFASLTGQIRGRFANDPAAFLAFVQDPENRDEMIALGLLAKPTEPDPPSPGTLVPEPGAPAPAAAPTAAPAAAPAAT